MHNILSCKDVGTIGHSDIRLLYNIDDIIITIFQKWRKTLLSTLNHIDYLINRYLCLNTLCLFYLKLLTNRKCFSYKKKGNSIYIYIERSYIIITYTYLFGSKNLILIVKLHVWISWEMHRYSYIFF